MIVWLAGYPRTGNTLARLILRETLRLDSSSMYDESETLDLFDSGAIPVGDSLTRAVYDRLSTDGKINVIKTHQAPLDNSPAIITVRDGRDAIVSAADWWGIAVWHAVFGENTPFADYSTFYKSWAPLGAPNRLVIRFEDAVANPDCAAEQMASFLSVPLISKFENRKAEWAASCPKVFSDHRDSWRSRMRPNELEMFWKMHGNAMGELGYEKGP